MKNMYRNGLAATALAIIALLPVSCSRNDSMTPTGGTVQVELTAQISQGKTGAASRALTRVANNEWELNDMVGIYMVTNGGTIPNDLVSDEDGVYANKRYRIAEGSGSSGFKLVAATPEDVMYYPEDDSDVDFIAYYPYRSDITGYKYALDIKEQDGTTNHDLLYSNDGTGSISSLTGSITFQHQLSKLIVKLEPKQSTLDLSVMTGLVTNVPVTGDFSLIDGTIDNTATGNIEATYSYSEDSGVDFGEGGDIMYTCFDIILLPHNTGAGANSRLNFSTSTKNYYWILPNDMTFESGKEYIIVLEIDGDVLRFESVTIKDWGEGAETLSIPMVKITAGEFAMGSPDGLESITFDGDTFAPAEDEDAEADEQPIHVVSISQDFYMSKYEITNAQYCLFMNAKGYTSATGIDVGNGYGAQTLFSGAALSYAGETWSVTGGKENHPIEGVSWFGAFAFAEWAGGYLPSEAQWEYACRGGQYFYSNAHLPYRWASYDDKALPDYAWFNNNDGTATKEVGKKSPNGFGLYDMHGNVSEWCKDWYDANYYASSSGSDPVNDTPGTNRVVRGGSFGNPAVNCRSAYRGNLLPTSTVTGTGFRVCFDIIDTTP